MTPRQRHTFSEPGERKAILSRARRMPGRQALKVLVLVAITAAVTWYANQKTNNPFSRPQYVRVTGDSTFSTIGIITPDTSVYVVSSSCHEIDHRIPMASHPWVLVSNSAYLTAQAGQEVPPPIQWHVLDSIQLESSRSRPNWPSPRHLVNPRMPSGVGIRILDDPTLGVQAWEIRTDDLAFLLIDGKEARIDSTQASSIREKFDVVVVSRAHPKKTQLIRNHLRPRYCIALPPGSVNLTGEANRNIICPASSEQALSFAVSPRGIVLDTVQVSP